MNICFVTSTLTSGGSERVMTLLANRFVERGYLVEVVHLNKHIVFYPSDNRVKMFFAEDEVGTSIMKKTRWLRKHVKDSRPDVVIPFMEAVFCFTLFSLIGSHVPVISSERIDPRKSPFIRNILRRIILPLTDWLVVQTQDIKAFYPRFLQRKTSVIYNPVSEQVFHLLTAPKENIVISVGKMDEQKNQIMLIRAFCRVADQFPSWKLVIYGEGPLRGKLESLVRDTHIKDRVLLPGRCDHVIDEMNKAKVFAFASNYEGMSNAILEAVCVGLPIITTHVSGASELVKDGGYIIPVGSETDMAQSLELLMGNEQLRKELGARNRKRAEEFKMEVIFKQWESLIVSLVKQ